MKKAAILFALVLSLVARVNAAPLPHHVSPATMNDKTQALFLESMDLNAKLWDESVHLIRSPQYVPGRKFPGSYLNDTHYWEKCCSRVRETSFYALGLLIRDAPGDRKTAAEALDAVLKQQYVTPGVRWFGTFKRTPEELDPGADAVMWRDYDPNWREFVGVTLEIILVEFPDRIPAQLAQRIYRSIDLAVEGEIAEKRLVPSYTNPALMYGALWDFAAQHDGRADWRQQSAAWIDNVYGLFSKFGAFSEYNSPTYYGVDLLGISLWRDYGSTQHIRSLGSTMESGLWHDVAALYQPELHNLCGPYDRSYGMDTEKFPSLVSIWMATAFDGDHTPLPPLKTLSGSALSYMPQIAVLGTRMSSADLAKLETFQGDHSFRRQITEDRVATAWIGKNILIGGETTNKTRDVGRDSQFHPATLQWRTPSGQIGWMEIAEAPMIDAAADASGLTISASGTIRLRIHAANLEPEKLTENRWDLPGLRVVVTADVHGAFSRVKADRDFNVYLEAPPDTYDLIYPDITRMKLQVEVAK